MQTVLEVKPSYQTIWPAICPWSRKVFPIQKGDIYGLIGKNGAEQDYSSQDH